jgi:hypothetical protein
MSSGGVLLRLRDTESDQSILVEFVLRSQGGRGGSVRGRGGVGGVIDAWSVVEWSVGGRH